MRDKAFDYLSRSRRGCNGVAVTMQGPFLSRFVGSQVNPKCLVVASTVLGLMLNIDRTQRKSDRRAHSLGDLLADGSAKSLGPLLR